MGQQQIEVYFSGLRRIIASDSGQARLAVNYTILHRFFVSRESTEAAGVVIHFA